MRYIEPHGHMVSRTTDDYQAMVVAGCVAVCEPAFWAGFDRGSVEGFRDYYRQLALPEPQGGGRPEPRARCPRVDSRIPWSPERARHRRNRPESQYAQRNAG